MVIVGLLTALAKKLLKDQAKKYGKVLYDRTLKPVLEGLKKKAKEYVANLARKPSNRKAKKAQRELDKINEDILTIETERAKLPGGPDFGDGPEIELGAPPKGNRLPLDDPVPTKGNRLPLDDPVSTELKVSLEGPISQPEAFEQELGERHPPGAYTREAELEERMAVELEEELAAFHPKYVKGVSVTHQIMEAINEQEQHAFSEMGSELLNNMPLHSGSGVAIRHEVEMLEMPKYKSAWLGDTMERAIFKETYKAMLPYTELGYQTLGLPPPALDPKYSFMYSDEEKAIARAEFEAQQVVQRSRAEKFESAFGDYRRDKQGLVRREVKLT